MPGKPLRQEQVAGLPVDACYRRVAQTVKRAQVIESGSLCVLIVGRDESSVCTAGKPDAQRAYNRSSLVAGSGKLARDASDRSTGCAYP
jgi:hypothetical protein